MLKRVLSVAALGVASVLMMSAAAQDRGLNDRMMASVEAMRDLGKPAARPRHRSEPERYAVIGCHCFVGQKNSAVYQGCVEPSYCHELEGTCRGSCQ